MIIFNEGLPGSGKSYEVVVHHIITALLNGRQIFAYVAGLNYEKFADITGLPLEKITGKTESVSLTFEEYSQLSEEQKKLVIKSADGWTMLKYTGLLHSIDESNVKTVYRHVANDSLVVLDELQDFWPVSMAKLDDEITRFVTRHRHRGIDIICMGQDHRDCHNLWKRRIDQLFKYVKRDALGMPDSYTWTSYKQKDGTFIKLRSGSGKYEPKYFGLYKSHTDETENKTTFTDSRSNIFKSPVFKYGFPSALLFLIFAIYYLYGFFTDGGPVKIKPKEVAVEQKPVVLPTKPVIPPRPEPEKKPQLTYSQGNFIEEVITETRPRLGALIEGKDKNGGLVISALIQFMDSSNHVKEELTLDQLAAFGWGFQRMSYGIKLIKGSKDIAVTAWPIDIYGQISKTYRDQIQANAKGS